MREPGALSTLGKVGCAVWSARVADCFARALERTPEAKRFLLPAPDERTKAIAGPDWTGSPVRVSACVGRERALRLLDWGSDELSGGGRQLQEEYIEWRVVRSGHGITRIELTTELSDYWRVLAAYEPEQLLETIAEFAGETAVPPGAAYGTCDPFAVGVTPKQREQSFVNMMLPPSGRSPYNNGKRAICCMVQKTNTLEALVLLTVAATNARVVRDATGGRLRCLTSSEAIPLLGEVAQLGRGSDPILVERLGRLAYEGRLVGFDDPPGVYIQSVEHTRLRKPTGHEVPPEWFSFSRGVAPEPSAGRRARYQRLTLEVPADEGFAVSDLIDVATEQPIRHGGEIADLVQLAVFFRVSEPEVVAVNRDDVVDLAPDAEDAEDAEGCAKVRDYERRFIEARGGV